MPPWAASVSPTEASSGGSHGLDGPHPGLVGGPHHVAANVPGPDAAGQAAVRFVGHHDGRVGEPPPDQFLD